MTLCDEIRAAMRAACNSDPDGELCELLKQLLVHCEGESASSESLVELKSKIAAHYDGLRDVILGLIDKRIAELG